MSWLRSVLKELWGLFVEDGSFALAIAVWIASTVLLLPKLLPQRWKGPIEFAGFAVVLMENVLRSAKRSRKH